MILQEKFLVKVHNRNIDHYKNNGYDCKNGDLIEVLNSHLPDGTRIKEERKCDLCDIIIERDHCSWNSTFKSFGKDLCPTCARKSISEKVKKTNLEKYGCEFPMQSAEIRDKARKATKEKYGCEYTFQIKEMREEANNSVIKKYGSMSNMASSEEVKNKRAKTNLKKYGVVNVFQSEDIKEKSKATLIEKYGVDNCSKVEAVREKAKNTTYEHYGVEYALQNPSILEKQRNTCIDLYGTEFPMQNSSIKEKANITMQNNGSVPTSSQQLAIYDMIKEIYGDHEVILNKPVSTLNLDISLTINEDTKIDIEYDGQYWHKDAQKDRRRDEYVKSMGYKVLRIKSNRLIPTKEQLVESINYLLKEENKYSHIILPDWKE